MGGEMYPGVTQDSDLVAYRWFLDRAGGGDVLRLKAIVLRKGKAKDDLEKRAALLRRDSVHGSFTGTIRVLQSQNRPLKPFHATMKSGAIAMP